MAAPGSSSTAIAFDGIGGTDSIPTSVLLAGMLRVSEKVSDLIFSPGDRPGRDSRTTGGGRNAEKRHAFADDTRRIAADLIGNNKQAISALREQGSCDISYGLPEWPLPRQRIHPARKLRDCDARHSDRDSNIPLSSAAAAIGRSRKSTQRDHSGDGRHGVGQVLDAGRVDRLDQQRILLSRPDGGRSDEFLHKHKRSTVHQRELHSDAPNFTLALRAALRQAPRVIMVGKSATRDA